jgi:hypothetical protein
MCGITVEGKKQVAYSDSECGTKTRFLNPKIEHYSKKQGAKLIKL